MDISNILRAEPGACFHGEVWVRCPHCHSGNEMMGARSEFKIDDWRVYKCKRCGKYFKDR